jgi:hypothetical protein
LFLYKDDQLICHIKDKIQDVRHAEITEAHAHYCIKGERHSTYYLITKRPPEDEGPNITIQQTVVLKGDESLALSYAYAKDESFFERFKEKIEKEYYWTVIDKKEGIMLVLQQGETIKYVSIEDVVSIEQIKENAAFIKDRLLDCK